VEAVRQPFSGAACSPMMEEQLLHAPPATDCPELWPPHRAVPKASWAEGTGYQWDLLLLKDKGHVTPQPS